MKTDDLLEAPSDSSDYATNKHWTFQTHTQDQTKAIRQVRARLAAMQVTVDKLADALSQDGAFDPEILKAEIRAAIESVDVRLDVSDAG
jgi:hypothetical protein